MIKPVFHCESKIKREFHGSACLLTISVGQEVHEGEKFTSTLELINRSFGRCVMLIDDTLQRHTMAIETNVMSSDELLAVSLQAGDNWLLRNRHAYDNLDIPLTIIRWNRWLEHEKYSYFKSLLLAECLQDSTYREKIDTTIDQFLTRCSKREKYNYLENQRARDLCFEYLLEECTAMCLWPELECYFEVYPSGRNAAMAETHRRFILPQYPHLLHSVKIKFKNRKQFRPQTFEFLPEFMDNEVSMRVRE